MTVKWEPYWYELDQSVVVGDVDLFYLSEDHRSLVNGGAGKDDCEVRAKIKRITHPELGEVKGIITIGLDYSIHLDGGALIVVNAEERPGKIQDPSYVVTEWAFDVRIDIIEETGLSSEERIKAFSPAQHKQRLLERKKRYKALLGLSEADWDR